MADNTIIAVVIVVGVVVFAIVMIVMLCQKSKAEAEIKLNARRRQQRRNSRMIGRAFSHKYFNPFGEVKSPPDSRNNSCSHSHNSNGDKNGDKAVSDHVEVVSESPVFVVDNVLESRGSLGNMYDPTDSRHPHRISQTHQVPRSHNTVTHTLQVPTLPECPPLPTSGQLETYDYTPHPLPPIDAAPQQGQYNSPNEGRGSEQE